MRKISKLILVLFTFLLVMSMTIGVFATDESSTPTDSTAGVAEAVNPTEPLPNDADPEPIAETEIAPPEESYTVKQYTSGGNITVYNYYHAFFVISEMNCIDGSPFLTSNSSWPGNSAADWGSCGGKYDLFYCIDFYAHGNANGATTKPGTTIEQTPAWQKLSHQAQKGIQLALIYGVPNCSSYYDNVYGYEATQIIIWEWTWILM